MPNAKHDIPGTWLVRVTKDGAPFARAIVTFTSDGGTEVWSRGLTGGFRGLWGPGSQ